MSDLDALYQDILLDHQENPRNFGPLPGATATHEGFNPMCGDRVKLAYVLGPDGVVSQIQFEGEGCAICMASASLMTEVVKQHSVDHAKQSIAEFRAMLQSQTEGESLGEEIQALKGVRRFPVRIKCALLAWTTFLESLSGVRGGTKA